MKFKLISMAVLLAGLVSCGNSEPKYSCDESVDTWVKEHITEVRKMTRSSWLESDEKFSIPMYRAFTAEQRINFWRGKFQEIKELSWSEPELVHINELESFFEKHLDLFETNKPSDNQLDEVEIFMHKWKAAAIEKLGWTDQIIYALAACGEKVLDTNGNLKPMRSNISSSVLLTSSENCNCNIDSWFTCSHQVACDNANCSETGSGCGFFLAYECNGRCEEP